MIVQEEVEAAQVQLGYAPAYLEVPRLSSWMNIEENNKDGEMWKKAEEGNYSEAIW